MAIARKPALIKGLRSSSRFESLLGQSKLFNVNKPSANNSDQQEGPMSRQVIFSTPASNHRKDFGLKRTMPRPLKSKYITLDNWDTKYGFTDYSPGSSKALVLKRINSLQAPVVPIYPRRNEYETGNDQNKKIAYTSPLFAGSTSISLNSTAMISNCLNKGSVNRKDFLTWLKTNYNQTYNELIVENGHKSKRRSPRLMARELMITIEPYILHYLRQKHSAMCDSFSVPEQSPINTAGLSYKLRGTLFNSRDGLSNAITAPGRILARNDMKLVAIAGIVSSCDLSGYNHNARGNRKLLHEKPQEFVIRQIRIKPESGNANIKVSLPSKALMRPSISPYNIHHNHLLTSSLSFRHKQNFRPSKIFTYISII